MSAGDRAAGNRAGREHWAGSGGADSGGERADVYRSRGRSLGWPSIDGMRVLASTSWPPRRADRGARHEHRPDNPRRYFVAVAIGASTAESGGATVALRLRLRAAAYAVGQRNRQPDHDDATLLEKQFSPYDQAMEITATQADDTPAPMTSFPALADSHAGHPVGDADSCRTRSSRAGCNGRHRAAACTLSEAAADD